MGKRTRDDEAIVRDLDQRWNDAYVRNDRSAFAEFLADDLGVTWPDGRFELAKPKLMEPTPARPVEFSERGFEIHGATAITRGRIRVEHPEGPAEQHFIRVYTKRDGRWQAVSVHVFPLVAPGDEQDSTSQATRPPRIETDRLVLTWPSREQVDGYYVSIAGSSMFDTIIWDGPTAPEELHAWWARAKHDPTRTELDLNLAVIEKASERCLGGVSLRPMNDDAAILDLGYAFAPAHHGRGFATEALRALIRHAFEARGAERVSANIFVGNGASKRVVEKLGFELEGTLRRAVMKRGAWLDEWLYATTRPRWECRGA